VLPRSGAVALFRKFVVQDLLKMIYLQTCLLARLTCDVKYLFQEIPEDELEIGKDELLVPVAHFNKVKTTLLIFIIKSCDFPYLLRAFLTFFLFIIRKFTRPLEIRF